MENSVYVGISGQVALEARMAVISNNIANMATPGYRAQNALFREFVSDPQRMKEDVSLVYDYGQYQVLDPGPIKLTGNPLDVALVGPGFMGVSTPEGVQYTRAGNFQLNENGEIVTSRGQPVADQGGGIITVPADAKYITIDENGIVSTDQGQVGNLMMVEFANYQDMEPAGNGNYKTDQQPVPATQTRMLQGKIEGSNVQSVLEMTRMIDVSRDYQSMQRMIQSEHDRLKGAIEKLLRA